MKSNDSKEEKRRGSRGDPGRGESRGERKRGAEDQRRPSVHTSTINPLLSEVGIEPVSIKIYVFVISWLASMARGVAVTLMQLKS